MIGIAARAAKIFERANCSYVITGGVAVVYYGVLRFTYDVDFLMSTLSKPKMDKLLALFRDEGFDFDEEEAQRKLGRGGIVRMEGTRSYARGFVIDLIARPDVNSIIKRGRTVEGDGKMRVISPEDLIIEKLMVIEETPPSQIRPQDKEDVAALLIIRDELDIDLDYLRKRAEENGVMSQLEKFWKKVEEATG